ncbi:MAG: rhodanese-like domain-containing protein [Gammaproteobacteria bacterium]|nr:rhodanese-like domain-containing protein [Gammaproteobacteria bacterium]
MEFVVANWYLFAALALILFMLFGSTITLAMNGIKSVNASQAIQLVNHDKGVMIDVCETVEYQQGHIPGAGNYPMSTLGARLKDLEKHKAKPVIVVCRSGNRSARAAVMLKKQGFGQVYNLNGGNMAWQRDSLPMEK